MGVIGQSSVAEESQALKGRTMGNSIKQWHKSVLLCSVIVGLLGGAALAAPDVYIQSPSLGYNVFNANEPWDCVDVTFWLGGQITTFTLPSNVHIYDQVPDGVTPGLQSAPIATTAGEHTLHFDMGTEMPAGTYYAVLQPGNATHGVFTSGTQDNVSFFSFDGANWSDLNTYTFDSGNPLLTWPSFTQFNAPGNFTISAVPSMAPVAGIVATGVHGDWEITDQQFVQGVFDTLDVEKTANELKPFVMEVDVTGGLDPIAVTEIVTNNTGEDWIGYGFQLGFWDDVEERFVPATVGDGLAFIQGYNNSNEFGAPTTFSPNSIYFDGALIPDGGTATFNLMVDLPGDPQFTFALRQYAIPEPGTAMLLGIAGLMLLGFRRRR
ncbi:MAG: PEP-CTERM sorting domain-containing protein [Thermoguttaceae bacterium]|nr:PEP-CTERM sorting domain-containing protein [Thermoguttaceae bacterium]